MQKQCQNAVKVHVKMTQAILSILLREQQLVIHLKEKQRLQPAVNNRI